jgi:alkylated DNA repair dioxygenase AlkB
MTLLFDAPLIAGLDYREELIGPDEEQELIERMSRIDLAPFRFHGWLGNRRTQSFGWRYDFEDASFTRTEPIPGWLQPLREKAGEFANISPDEFVHVLLARYDPGAGIGWHRDRDVFDKVVGISLNTPATLRFRQRVGSGFRRASLEVAPRSAYLLSGESRWDWEHRIVPGEELRFSVTFRTLSDKGRGVAAGNWAGTVVRGSGSRGHGAQAAAVTAVVRRRLRARQRARSRSPVHQAGALARRRMGAGQRAGEQEWRDPDLRSLDAPMAALEPQDRVDVADPSRLALRRGDPGAPGPARRCGAGGASRPCREAEADRGRA